MTGIEWAEKYSTSYQEENGVLRTRFSDNWDEASATAIHEAYRLTDYEVIGRSGSTVTFQKPLPKWAVVTSMPLEGARGGVLLRFFDIQDDAEKYRYKFPGSTIRPFNYATDLQFLS